VRAWAETSGLPTNSQHAASGSRRRIEGRIDGPAGHRQVDRATATGISTTGSTSTRPPSPTWWRRNTPRIRCRPPREVKERQPVDEPATGLSGPCACSAPSSPAPCERPSEVPDDHPERLAGILRGVVARVNEANVRLAGRTWHQIVKHRVGRSTDRVAFTVDRQKWQRRGGQDRSRVAERSRGRVVGACRDQRRERPRTGLVPLIWVRRVVGTPHRRLRASLGATSPAG
jgi:hypothetical protein